MSKVSAILNYTDSYGNSKQKSFTDINPNASYSEIKSFAQGITSLTNNVYDSTYRVDRVECDSAADKQTPTLTVALTEFSKNPNTGAGTAESNYSYNGDGTLYVTKPVCTSDPSYSGVTVGANFSPTQIFGFAPISAPANTVFQFQVCATETNNFKAPEPVTITFTVLG